MELRAAGLLIVPATPGADTEYECPTCSAWSRWTRGRSLVEGDMADEFQCPACGATSYLATCNSRPAALQAENERLKAELEPYEVLNPQQCANGVHVDWLVDSEHSHACPWCRIAELATLLKQAQDEARTARGAEDEYPPALPWAALMDNEDRTDFLDELAASAVTYTDTKTALEEVEDTCSRWRAIAEAQHAHNTAEGPDAVERGDR